MRFIYYITVNALISAHGRLDFLCALGGRLIETGANCDHIFTKMRRIFYKNTALSNQGCKRRPNLKLKILLHDERIFFYKDDLVLAHMGANSRRALILSNWFLGGR